VSEGRSTRTIGSRAGRPRLAALAAAAMVLAAMTLSAPASASHGDGTYDQPVWFTWAKRHLNVVIIPADHGPVYNGHGVMAGDPITEAQPCANSYTRAMKRSALDWKTAINAFGPSWLKNLTMTVNVLGCDTLPSTSTLGDPDIIVAADENKATVLGLSVSTRPCISLNSKMLVQSFTYNDMYTVSGHEFGHCLGLDHVRDEHPDADILDATVDEVIGTASNPRHCPSNLNVNTLKGVFTLRLLGQSGSGVAGTVSVGSYAQISC
jgi:hypothetical protein